MLVLRNALKAGSIGFAVLCILEILRLSPPLYCLKGILQIFLWFAVGMLVAYFFLRDTKTFAWGQVLLASLLASALTILGGVVSSVIMNVILSAAQRVLLADTVFPTGLDPLDRSLFISLLGAVILGAIGAVVMTGVWRVREKPLSPETGVVLEKTSGLSWLLYGGLGGLSLVLLMWGVIKFFSGFASGNISPGETGELVKSFWLYIFPPGVAAGLIVNAGRKMGQQASKPGNRSLSVLVIAAGVFLYIAVFLAIVLFFLTLDMM